nr:hypothetical protein [Streptomyces sp. TLI_235]
MDRPVSVLTPLMRGRNSGCALTVEPATRLSISVPEKVVASSWICPPPPEVSNAMCRIWENHITDCRPV